MRDGVEVVIALGGDGTVNEVVNGLLTDGVHASVPTLGIVPAGSTNVFARALGLPNDAVEATSVLLDAMSVNRRRSISLGMAEERYFLFAAGLGFDAAVVSEVESQRRRGKKSTHALYVRTTLATYLSRMRTLPPLTVHLADGRTLTDVKLALVTNTTPWTFLGNRPLAPTPRASFDAGLDLYVRTGMSMPSVAWALIRMIRQTEGHLRIGNQVEHDLGELTLTSAQPLPLQVDGDYLSDHSSVRFRAVPNGLKVFV